MRKRSILGMLAATAAAVYIARFALKSAEELRRYDHMRSLSNEGPIREEAADLLKQILLGQRDAVKEWLSFLKSAPKDAARYTKIETI
jgi:hypothetical protein